MVENPFARDPAVTVGIAGDASSLDNAIGNAVGRLGDLRAQVGIAGAALGALAAGGLVKATSAAASFEEQMVEVEKVTDPETAAQMGDAIQDMASAMPVAQEELAGITAQAGRFGIEGTENIEQFTETVSQMAVATDLSTDQAGESFARLSTLMDEPIDRVGDMGNVINELSNTMATSSSEITDSALRSSGVLSQMGASSEDILALTAAMNEASESSERAGTRLRRMAQEIQDPAKVEDLAAALGMSNDEFARLREENPTALFQTMAQTMGEGGDQADELRSTLSTTSQQALTALSQNMEGLSDAQETANEQMRDGTSLQEEYDSASSTFNSQLQVTRNRLRNVAIGIGENVLPAASELLGYVNDAIAAFSDWNDRTDGMAGTIGLVATALGGFAVAAASAVSALGGMSAIIGAVGGALGILTGPIGLAIAAVALLAGAWQTNFLGIRDVTSDVLAAIQGFWDDHGEAIIETATDAFETVRNTIDGVVTFLRDGLIEPVLDSIQELWETHGSDLLAEVRATWDAVQGYIQTAVDVIWDGIIQPILQTIQRAWDRWGDEIMTIVDAVFGAIELAITGALDTVATIIRTTLALIRGDWDDAWNLIVGFLERSWDRITSFLETDALQALTAAISIVTDAAKAAFGYLVGTGDGTLIGDVMGVIGDIASWIRDDAAGQLADAITNVFTGLGEAAWNAFRDTFNAAIGSRSITVPEVDLGPAGTFGGQSLSLPSLDTGGVIDETGQYIGHAGERVLTPAETRRADETGMVGDPDIEDDVESALRSTDRTDDLIAEQRQTRRAIRALADEFDLDVQVDSSDGRFGAI